jgi:hypothetical protein
MYCIIQFVKSKDFNGLFLNLLVIIFRANFFTFFGYFRAFRFFFERLKHIYYISTKKDTQQEGLLNGIF